MPTLLKKKYFNCEICNKEKTTRTQQRSKHCHKCSLAILYQEERKKMQSLIRVCIKCSAEKENNSINFVSDKNGIKNICRSCDASRRSVNYKDNIKREKNYRLKKEYGISIEEYDERLKKQNGCCAICLKQPSKKRLAVDHSHSTGKIRGLLCSNCNTAIGKFKDDKSLLAKAIDYLS